jgi:hypothetical protein
VKDSDLADREQFLPAAIAARKLRVSSQTVLNMLKDGRLSGIDRGIGLRPRWLVSRRSLAMAMSRSRDEPADVDDFSHLARELQRHKTRIEQLKGEISSLVAANESLLDAVRALSRALERCRMSFPSSSQYERGDSATRPRR